MGRGKPTVVSVVGARPQFIKLAALLNKLDRAFDSRVVHTGQHYDPEMSDEFFAEYRLRPPDTNLNVGPASVNRQLARMLDRLDRYLTKVKPQAVLVFGDTTTTMAGALAAASRDVPLAHVEAGLRCFDLRMAEERNRLVADHLATWLFCPTSEAVRNLKNEGIRAAPGSVSGTRIHPVGDVMAETFRLPRRLPSGIFREWWGRHSEVVTRGCRSASDATRSGAEKADNSLSGFSLRSASFGTRPTRNCPLAERPSFYYVTLHRAEAVDDADNLRRVVEILEVLPEPVVFPVHPRTRKNLRRFGLLGVLRHSPHIRLLPPVNHRTSLWLIANASAVLTDSGGIQKEAYWAGVRCFTLRRVTEWGLLVDAGWNELVGFSKTKLRRAMASPFAPRRVADPVFARRDASTAIVRQLQADLR